MQKFIILIIISFSNLLFSQPPSQGPRNIKTISKIDSNLVYTEVDQLPEFSAGGLPAFRNMIHKNFKKKNFIGDGMLKTEITFFVERDGALTNIIVNGPNADFNNEVKHAISLIKENWNPAEKMGEKVRFRYKMPITMLIE
ncbi:hypothetical protein [Kaistella jeonii]|uniref:hypothetical protein n=1 Tax=Kaistella jeonii TaxID=266749 RepID=UPI0008F08D7E|nr:hypothetical protein [Kaistella jeonii]SFB79758.1 protein TonB [Kaistella jeonii]VEI96246.1 Uncharacterised protein [Kaistella jeonii]